MQPPCRKGCLAFRRVLMASTLFWMWSTPKRTLRCAISYTCAYIINSPQETRRRDPNPKGMPCTDYVRTILYHRYMLKLHTYTRCSYMYHNMISFTAVSCIPELPQRYPFPLQGCMAGRLRFFLKNWQLLQMGARSGIRLPHSLYAHTHPILLPPATHNGGGIFIHSDRNLFSSATGGHCGATEDPSRGLLLHCIHSPQEGRRPTTYHKPEEPQQVHSPPTFQDGGYPYSKGRYLLWGLHDQARLEGCLLYDSGHTLAAEIPLPSMEREKVPVYMPPFRPLHSTSDIHQGYTSSSLLPQEQRSLDGNILGRYAVPTPTEGEASRDQEPSIREPRISGELQEIRAVPSPQHQLPRFFSRPPIESPQGQSSIDCAGSSEIRIKHQWDPLAHMIGIFSSTIPAVLPAPLH